MIDLDLSKLALIGVVALVVIGPEKLPKVARMAGSLFGRAQRYIHDVKAEVNNQLALEELLKLEKDAHEATLNFGQSIAQSLAQANGEVHVSPADEQSGKQESPDPARMALRARDFRRKKLIQASEIPGWYKRLKSAKPKLVSCAARVSRYRLNLKPG